MSHTMRVGIQIKSLKALDRALKRLGLNFKKDQKTFAWEGRNSRCDHAITAPNTRSEIGVIKKQGKEEYELQYGAYDLNGLIGNDASILKKEYAVAAATLEAEKEGMYVHRYDNKDGSVRLEAVFQ